MCADFYALSLPVFDLAYDDEKGNGQSEMDIARSSDTNSSRIDPMRLCFVHIKTVYLKEKKL